VIGLDTNILLRFIVKDDAAQFELVSNFIRKLRDEGKTMYITDVVLSEIIWTLRTGYKYKKSALLRALQGMTDTADLIFESEDLIESVISAYQKGRGDFTDYLIAERCYAAGCESLATFDKALLREKGFVGVA
jgi:predicted nucleic-acid-binding protein